MINIDKKYTNIHSKDFFTGFEVEFLLKSNYTLSQLKTILNKVQKGIIVGRDGSLETDDTDHNATNVEVRTIPTIPIKSVNVLNNIFEVVDKMAYINNSCGLHFSVSPISDEIYEKVNPFYIAKHPLWRQIKKDFKRSRNEYCKNYDFSYLRKKITPMYLWKNNKRICPAVEGDCHYMVVNFDNYKIPRTKESRIEIRAFGGKDFHKKRDLIVDYIDKSLQVIKDGYSNTKEIKLI